MLGTERTEFVAARLTGEEKALFRELAKIEQVSVSGLLRLWIRSAGVNYGLLKPPLKATAKEVSQR